MRVDRKPKIAFIGLGLMGAGFTNRLTALGYEVTGYDADSAKVAAAAGWGVEPADSAALASQGADIVQICVLETSSVRDIVLGKDGVAETGQAGAVVVDHGTTVLDATREMAEELERRCGMAWVDAPVSGGPSAAEDGSLAIMAGGSDDAIAKIHDLMEDLSGVFTHMGGVGAGQITKMVNQVLVLTNYCVIAEAVKLGEAGGVDVSKIPEALATGHAGSNLLNALLPRIVERNFEPMGRAKQVLKDLDMLHDLTRGLEAPTPMADQARTLFRLLCARGHQDLDGTAVFKLYDEPPV